MKLFGHREPQPPRFPPEEFEPLLRKSICTGEETGCVREKATGKIREVQLIRDRRDLEEFCRACGARPEDLKTVY
ncbi:MAG: aspartate dehydrogenase [Oscillospiraceae bacterium]|nr:aspartate dehydrogenase [Oscillospiraceae bacterium]